MSASAFSMSAMIPDSVFEVSGAAPVLGGLRNPELRHYFCPQCMSWMFTRFIPGFVNVRVTMLDETAWFVPFIETWTKTRMAWLAPVAAHQFGEFPAREDFPGLVAEFARTLSAT